MHDSSSPPSEDGAKVSEGLDSLLREVFAAPAVEPSVRGHLVRGTVIDGCYQTLRRLGTGGMGVVYLAQDIDLDRPVAIKLRLGETTQPQLARLWREAKMMARLSHPHVISVYELGAFEGMVFIAMEYLERGTAREWLAERSRTLAEIVALYVQAGQGLSAAHAVGVVHRDFKPDNVLVGADGSARVADFGLAQPVSAPGDMDGTPPRTVSESESESERLTRTGTMVGTPAYMAPEQHRGEAVDARADQFSFCVSLFEALYGRRPSAAGIDEGESERGSPDTPTRGGVDVPVRIARVLQRGMSTEPQDRYPDMPSLLAALQYDPSRRRGWAYAAVGAGSLAGVVGLVSYRAAERGPACDDGAERIAATWNGAARGRLTESFAATGLPIQQASLDRALIELDAYAADWGGAHDEACEATHVRGEQSAQLLDRRIACLDRGQSALAAAIEVLAAADAAVVEHAVDVARSVPALTRCANATALRAEIEPPPERAAAGVEAIRGKLDRSRAEQAAGRLGASASSANEALADAEAQDYEPVVAQALVRVASVQAALGDNEAAIEPARRAYEIAIRNRQDGVAIEAALHAPFLALELAETLVWLDTAEALAHRVGMEATYLPEIALVRGSAYMEATKYDLAERELEEAIRLAPDPVKSTEPRQRLAFVLRVTGRPAKARELLDEVLSTKREAFGERSWIVASALEELAATLRQLGELEEARRALDEVIAIHRAAAGPDAPRSVSALDAAAAVAAEAGDYRRAKALLDEALALLGRLDGARPRGTIALVSNAADVWARLGDMDGAIELAGRGVGLAVEQHGDEHVATASTRINLAALYVSAGRNREAERELLVAGETLTALLGPTSRELLAVQVMLTQALKGEGRLAEAREAAERASTIANALHPEPHFDLARVASSLGLLLRDEGRPREAVAQFVRCSEIVEEVRGPDHPKRVDCLYRQGLALSEAGEDPTAVYEAAAAIVDRGAEVEDQRAAKLFAALAERVRRSDGARARKLAQRAREAANRLKVDDPNRVDVLAGLDRLWPQR